MQPPTVCRPGRTETSVLPVNGSGAGTCFCSNKYNIGDSKRPILILSVWTVYGRVLGMSTSGVIHVIHCSKRFETGKLPDSVQTTALELSGQIGVQALDPM